MFTDYQDRVDIRWLHNEERLKNTTYFWDGVAGMIFKVENQRMEGMQELKMQ